MKIKNRGYKKRQGEMTGLTEMLYNVLDSKTLTIEEKIEKLNSLKEETLDFAARTAVYMSCVTWSKEMLENLDWSINYLEKRR